MMTYPMHVAGLVRDLPICKVTEDFYIGAFIMFGDAEITVACAKELLSAGVEVGWSKQVKTGFKVGPKEGGYYISFSDADLEALLSEYLREKVSRMLFKA